MSTEETQEAVPESTCTECVRRRNEVGVTVRCTVCGQRKVPRGRSASPAIVMCDHDCPGYWQEPKSGDLWPGESRESFGYPTHECVA